MKNPIDRTLSRLPYVKGMFEDDELQSLNKKFDIFSSSSITKDKQIQRLSVVNQYDHEMEFATNGGKMVPLFYHQLMNGISSNDKKRRMLEYRSMSKYSMVASALREICNEMFVKDDQGEIIKCKLRGDYNDEVKSIVQEEFQKFIKIFKLEEKGWKYMWDHLVEGELFFENVVSLKEPERGIMGLTRIAAERIDPLYYDLDNELIDSYILRAKQQDQYPYQWGKSSLGQYTTDNQTRLIFLNDKQITYISNNEWEESAKKYKLPALAEANRPYRQLSLIEDATIIYMLVRAPQRLVFNVDVGNLPPSKAEQFLQRLMAKFWTKKSISTNGQVTNEYDAQGILENYYFAKTREGTGTEVKTLDGGNASPDNLEILNFFVKKLYDSLHVPISRLNSDTTFADGENISREELRFATFIMEIQKQWSFAIKETFITHLKLKGKKIIEAARKLKVDEFEMTAAANNPKQKVKFQNVYLKDSVNWDNTCWDLIHDLDNAIYNKLDTTLEKLNNNLAILEDKIEERNEERLHLYEQKSIEEENSEDLINENVENIKLQLDIINREVQSFTERCETILEQIEALNDIKEDNQSWWEQYGLKHEEIDVTMNPPTQFFTIRQQQLYQQKLDNYNNMTANDMIDNILMQKECLGWDDKKILANRHFLITSAGLRWMLANIEQNGPDFREKALKEMQGATDGSDLDLGGLGGGGGGLPSGDDTSLPEFGEQPQGEAGGEAAPAQGQTTGQAAPAPQNAPNAESYKIPMEHITESFNKTLYLSNVANFNLESMDDQLLGLLKDINHSNMYQLSESTTFIPTVKTIK